MASSKCNSDQQTSKPVVVRVKRKTWLSKLDAFWLEINERPLKRPFLNSENLSIDRNDSNSNHVQDEELKCKKLFVQHVETASTPEAEAAIDVVQSVMFDSSHGSKDKAGIGEQKRALENDRKQEELLSKGRRDREVLAQNARFEQIWRSRRGYNEPLHQQLHSMCHFYDVVRVHDDEGSNELQEQKTASLEDQRNLSKLLPIPKEFIPSAVAEIEADIYSYLAEQGHKIMPRSVADMESDIHAYLYEQDGYVYDYYTVKDDLDIGEQDAISSFPVVQVIDDDGDFYDGPDYVSEYDSEDSNAEANPRNDYPDEASGESSASTDEENEEVEEEEIDNASSASSEFEGLRHRLAWDGVPSNGDGFHDNGDLNFDYMDINKDLNDME